MKNKVMNSSFLVDVTEDLSYVMMLNGCYPWFSMLHKKVLSSKTRKVDRVHDDRLQKSSPTQLAIYDFSGSKLLDDTVANQQTSLTAFNLST